MGAKHNLDDELRNSSFATDLMPKEWWIGLSPFMANQQGVN
jgi:hypothetical protein